MSLINDNLHVNGTITAVGFQPPAGSINAAAIPAGANILTSALVHSHKKDVSQAPGTAVVAATQDIHIGFFTGAVVSIKAAITGAIATGADRTVTVDLQKSTGAAAFATILTGVITFNNVSTLRAVTAGTLSSVTWIAGDILRVVVAVAGAAGAQAQGLIVTVTLDENYQ